VSDVAGPQIKLPESRWRCKSILECLFMQNSFDCRDKTSGEKKANTMHF